MWAVTIDTESAATGANGVSDVAATEEESADGDSGKVKQVIDSVFKKL